MSETKKYIESVGRRKTSTARARLTPATKNSVQVNDKELAVYFKTEALQNTVLEPLAIEGAGKFSITIKVIGGGISSQAEAVRHAISRAIEKSDRLLRAPLKKAGYLTRDSRAKERRKFGLKKARKSPQWSKR